MLLFSAFYSSKENFISMKTSLPTAGDFAKRFRIHLTALLWKTIERIWEAFWTCFRTKHEKTISLFLLFKKREFNMYGSYLGPLRHVPHVHAGAVLLTRLGKLRKPIAMAHRIWKDFPVLCCTQCSPCFVLHSTLVCTLWIWGGKNLQNVCILTKIRVWIFWVFCYC